MITVLHSRAAPSTTRRVVPSPAMLAGEDRRLLRSMYDRHLLKALALVTNFTDAERTLLRALIDRIVPEDGDPGALALGADRYVFAQLEGPLVADRALIAAGLAALPGDFIADRRCPARTRARAVVCAAGRADAGGRLRRPGQRRQRGRRIVADDRLRTSRAAGADRPGAQSTAAAADAGAERCHRRTTSSSSARVRPAG